MAEEKTQEKQVVTESQDVSQTEIEKEIVTSESVVSSSETKQDVGEEKSEKENSTAPLEEESVESEDDSEALSVEVLTEPSITNEEFGVLRKEVRDLGKKKEWLFETRSLVSQQIKELFAILKDKKEQRDELTSKVKELKSKREEINSEIKQSIGKIKTISGTDSSEERVPVGKIKRELQNLQYKVETTPMSPEEEKKVMRLIKEKEKQIAKVDQVTELKGESKELSKQINDSKKSSNDIHSQIQDAAKASQENHEEMISVSKDIKYLKAREKEIHYVFSEVKDVYKEKRKVYTQNKKFFEKAKPKRKDSPKVTEEQVMEKVEANVEEKMKKGMKITTEDLMSFGK